MTENEASEFAEYNIISQCHVMHRLSVQGTWLVRSMTTLQVVKHVRPPINDLPNELIARILEFAIYDR